MPAQYPDINGVRFDYSCVTVSLNAKSFRGIKSVNYNDSLEPGDVFGTGAQRIGRTRGQYKADGSIEFYEEEWRDFLASIPKGVGTMEVVFPVSVAYARRQGDPTHEDKLIGCRIKKIDDARQEGTEALTVKVDLDIMRVERSGRDPLTQMLK